MDDQVKDNNYNAVSAETASRPISSEILTCHNYWCNYKTDQPLSICPKCGRPLLTSQTFSALGWILGFIGTFLALVGSALLIFAAPKLVGGTGVKLLVWGIFGLLLIFGMVIMVGGFKQALSGKRSQSVMTVIILLLAALAIIIAIGRLVLGES